MRSGNAMSTRFRGENNSMQKMFQGFMRSIYLDIYAEYSNGIRYKIEIQQSNEGADPRRARFLRGA